jgi:hypothetical protein
MKKYFLVIFLAGCLAGGASYAADTTDQQIQKDQEQLKVDYQKKINHDLKNLDRKIKHIRHHADAQVNAGLKDAAKQLEDQKAKADQKLLTLEKSTGDAWKDLRSGMDKAVDDLKLSVDRATKQFDGPPTPIK